MANSATIQVRIDAKTKDMAEKIFKRCGMTTSDAIRIFLHQAVEEKGMPFRSHIPSVESREAIEEYHAGGGKKITLDDLRKQWDEA